MKPEIAISAMLNPRRIAVIGASASKQSQGNLIIENLVGRGYKGEIFPVHPTAAKVSGIATTPTIADLPDGIDSAAVAVPAAAVPQVLRDLEARNIPSAVVMANGFTHEDGEEVKRIDARGGTRVHGPNCMGFINLSDEAAVYTAEIPAIVRKGPVGLIAQSGSAAIAVMNTTLIGFSQIITVGSEFGLNAADYLNWLATDPNTRAIALVIESLKDPTAFAAAVARARENGKPVVALKVGRNAFGARATEAHTGALVSPYDAYRQFFEDIGVPLVSDYVELVAAFEILALDASLPAPGGPAIIGISGGETALACDVAAEVGLKLAEFSDETRSALLKLLPGLSGFNPIDFGSSLVRTNENVKRAVETVLQDPEVNSVIVVQDMQTTLPPEYIEGYLVVLDIVAEAAKTSKKPIVVISPTGDALHEELIAPFRDTRIACVRGLRAGLVGMRAKVAQMRPKQSLPATPTSRKQPVVKARPGGNFSISEVREALASHDIPFIRSAVFENEDAAVSGTRDFEFPVVAKIVSADINHRSDVGGVIMNITDSEKLREALTAIRNSVGKYLPDAHMDGFEVQEQVTGGVEIFAGFLETPPFGPLITVGAGGVMVELYKDFEYGLAPMSADEFIRKLEKTRIGQLLGGFRNLHEKTPLEPLARLLENFSRLAINSKGLLTAAELNPILVSPGSGKAVVVDALFLGRKT